MTIEFWPKPLRQPRNRRKRKPKKRRTRRPKLPVRAGKAQQLLSSAIIRGDHELASWIDGAVKTDRVSGRPDEIQHLRERLDSVMEPLPS